MKSRLKYITIAISTEIVFSSDFWLKMFLKTQDDINNWSTKYMEALVMEIIYVMTLILKSFRQAGGKPIFGRVS